MSNADLLFGGITIVGGIVGTLAGGFILDQMSSTIPNAFKLLSTATFFGAVFCFSAFCFKNMYVFIVLFLIGEILVFATQGPVNFVSMHAVKPSLRPLAMAMYTVSIHVFGDVPSSELCRKMPIEFVVLVNRRTYPRVQELPEVFELECYNGNKHLYLTSSARIRKKVWFITPIVGPMQLKGRDWKKFAKENIGPYVEWLHFIQEGDDSFYVTGYDARDVTEFRGYDVDHHRYYRFKSRVWADANMPQRIAVAFLSGIGQAASIRINCGEAYFMVPVVRVNVPNGPDEYEMNPHVWNIIKVTMGLQVGQILVFTNEHNTVYRLMAFNFDGSPHTPMHFYGATQLHHIQPAIEFDDKDDDRMHHICRWPGHRDHFGEAGDTFYKSYSMITVLNRLTIPVMMIHQNVERTFTVKMEFHKEDPGRTNHVNVFGEWREFAYECNFGYNKMIRFKFMHLLTDMAGDEVEEYPVFHVC